MGRIRTNKQYIVPGALISASYVSDIYDLVTGNLYETTALSGSLSVTGSIYGTLIGTASWAQSSSVAISSSFARSASFATSASSSVNSNFAISASYAPFTGVTRIIAGDNITINPTSGVGNVTISAATTSSGGGGGTIDTSSFVTTAQTASMTVLSASYAANSAAAFPYTGSAGISGSFSVNGSVFVNLTTLPTEDPHNAGQIWRSGNFIMVSLG